MRRSRGYGSYRGRGRGGAARIVLIVIAVCLALLIGAFLFLSRYLVYTDDGVRLDIPFFQREEPDDPADTQLVVEGSPSPTPTMVVEEQKVQAVLLPVSSLADGTAADLLRAANANAAVFDMKTDEGMLGYVSGMEGAVNARTSQSDPMLNAAIAAGNGDELYSVARISCFRDRLLSSHRMSFSILSTNGYRWKDTGGVRWVSPMSRGATDYLLGVVEELCVLGFDEILLDNCGFPADEKITSIQPGDNYPADAAAREQAVRDFLEKAGAVADSHGVKLSVRTTGAALEGGEAETSGLTPAALLAGADRLWVDAADLTAGIQYASEDERSGIEAKLVTVLPAGGDTAALTKENWAILD